MNIKNFNWQIWAGFLLSFLAALSYPIFFVNFPLTRDFPWVTFLLFAVAAVFLFIGVRRGFRADRPHPTRSKVIASILLVLSVLVIGLFTFSAFIMAKWLPASTGAPQVGRKAPDFTLTDSSGQKVSLSTLLSTPVNGKVPKGVLLVFYRGYW